MSVSSKIMKWVISHSLISALFVFILYFIIIHLIPFWNEKIVPHCVFALKFSESSVTDLFIPVFLVLIAYAFFDRYKLYEELETSCHLVKAEIEANEHLMVFFEKFVLKNIDHKNSVSEFDSNVKFCLFRHFHLDRFKIGMNHIKSKEDEQKLNKWRSKSLQTVNLLNNWLMDHQKQIHTTKDLDGIKKVLENKFKRLREENAGMMGIMNELLKSYGLEKMELTIKDVIQR